MSVTNFGEIQNTSSPLFSFSFLVEIKIKNNKIYKSILLHPYYKQTPKKGRQMERWKIKSGVSHEAFKCSGGQASKTI